MSEGILIAIFSVMAGAIAALAGMHWRHTEQCKLSDEKLAEIGSDVKRIIQEIGTHETGMRGTIHKHASVLTRHELEIENFRRRRQGDR